jgi:crotonobetaine/carnitine-CoA ligase
MSDMAPKRFNDIARLVEAQATLAPDFDVATFVEVLPDGSLRDERRSFAALHDRGRRLAAWLQHLGVRPGDRFALMLQNHPEFIEAMVAGAYLGATFVPLDPRSVGDKLVYMLNFVEARVVIAGDYAIDALAQIAKDVPAVRHVLVVGDQPSDMPNVDTLAYATGLPLSDTGLTTVIPDPDSAMFMMFTSGTTGNPKAVVRTHAKYMRGMKGLRDLGVTATDTIYTGLPLCHINAHSSLAAALSMPVRVVISRRFTKSRLWDICRAYGCTVFTLLGGMIPELYSVPERTDDADNPVRLVIASGMPAALWGEYERRFEVTISEVYGSTEAGGILLNVGGEGPRGSMGRPPRGMIAAVLDGQGAICPPGVAGELCFRPEAGETEAITYFRNTNASRDKTLGGWFRSGDIAHMDADGWFYFHHRAGGGVRRNGDFVNTGMVETVLAQSPQVADVYVYGVATPDNVAGEKTLVAALVLRDGTADDVRTWATGRLQKNELPEIWQVLDAIPKTVSEKPVDRELIALLHTAGLVQAAA